VKVADLTLLGKYHHLALAPLVARRKSINYPPIRTHTYHFHALAFAERPLSKLATFAGDDVQLSASACDIDSTRNVMQRCKKPCRTANDVTTPSSACEMCGGIY